MKTSGFVNGHRIRPSIQRFKWMRRGRGGRMQSGILIADCMIYIGLLFVIVSMGYVVFYRGWDNSVNLSRNAGQIARALTTGERWREDVRTATGPVRAEESNGDQFLHLPHGSGEITYRASQGAILRRANENSAWIEVLNRVKSSRMEPEARQKVTAWRWELELKTREPKRRFQPALTFEAVPVQRGVAAVADSR